LSGGVLRIVLQREGCMKLLAVLIFVLPIAMQGQAERRFEFRGLYLADSITSELQRTHRLSCSRDIDKVEGLEFCSFANREFAGGRAFIIASLVDRKISGFHFRFDQERYMLAFGALQSRWGDPDSLRAEVVKNQMGAEFENTLARWVLSDGVVELDRYVSTVTESGISISYVALDSIASVRRACVKAKASLRDFGGTLPEGCK
jgi:hypothetical protein